MLLGKKLEVTDMKGRLKLLVDGQTFVTKTGEIIGIDSEYTFTYGDTYFYDVRKNILLGDWYHPTLNYLVNGVELPDLRVTDQDNLEIISEVYISSTEHQNGFKALKDIAFYSKTYIKYVLKNDLIHRSPEAAASHTSALILKK